MDEDEFVDDQERQQYIEIKGLVPPLPIYVKPAMSNQPKPILKMQVVRKDTTSITPSKRLALKFESEDEEGDWEDPEESNSAFGRYLSGSKCIYAKFGNSRHNKLYRTEYFAGLFCDRRQYKLNKVPLTNIKQLFSHILGDDLNDDEQELATNPNEVRFDSYFESGNLFGAYRRSIHEYDLVLQNDINSKGNTQWFYFSIANLPKDMDVTFNILNLTKSDSLFNYGMQPAVFSKLAHTKHGTGWYRSGKDISYQKNQIKRQSSRRRYYTLTFKITPKFQNDTIFIAHCFPYSYSSLQEYLESLVKSPYRRNFVQRGSIGKSVGNNSMELLTIAQPLPAAKDPRKIIVFMARQHPGESQGSFVCEGVINFLVSKTKQAEFLRSKFIFKIIPMINPDGVIFGNYRTNLSGLDLNRRWNVGDYNQTFPEVTSIKTFISQLNKDKKIRFIIDLHGHSKKLNSFFYGNPNARHPERVRMLPFLCSKLNSQISFEDSTFTIQQDKKKTARVYLSLTHQITCIYTYECSFYGYLKDGKKLPFGADEFRGLGTTLCQGLFSILESEWLVDHKQSANSTIMKLITELKTNTSLIELGNRDSSGSDSQPEAFELQDQEVSEIEQTAEQLRMRQKEQLQLMRNRTSIERNQTNEANLTTITITPKQTISNCLPSRNTIRSSKQSNRPYKKKMVVMSLSKVNSILPDKYQMALQPMSMPKREKEKEVTYRPNRSQRLMLFPDKATQTQEICEKDWLQMKKVEGDRNLSSHKNWRSREAKYSSVCTTTRVRKNMVLKLQIPHKPFLSVTNYGNQASNRVKDKQTQTDLTFLSQREQKMRTLSYYNAGETQKSPQEAMPVIRALKIHSLRQDSNALFDDMIKRYLLDAQKFKTRICPSENHIFLQKNRFGEPLEKSLSIRKKEFSSTKKGLRKKSD